MIKIHSITEAPLACIPFLNVSSRREVVRESLPIIKATVDGLPKGLEAILVTADLQGREVVKGGWGRLLGVALPELCQALVEQHLLPQLDRVGVILGGDFYTREAMDRRGGSGDVRPVWSAFSEHFRWVAGVAGNHDFFGKTPSVPDFKAFLRQPKIHFLDRASVSLDGLKIAGLSGVIGDNTNKLFRRPEKAFAKEAASLAAAGPDVLVMHDGPDGDANQRGSASVREALEGTMPTLVIRGHAHWAFPLATLRNGTQVLNVDSRVILLVANT